MTAIIAAAFVLFGLSAGLVLGRWLLAWAVRRARKNGVYSEPRKP